MNQAKQVWVDTSKWDLKCFRVQAAVGQAISNVLDWALPEVRKKVLENVEAPGSPYPLAVAPRCQIKGRGGKTRVRGPQTNAGTLPVPIVWGQLRKSIQMRRISSQIGTVYSDSQIANYNVYVHYGTRKMRPRPFVEAAGKERRPAVTNRFKYEIQKAAQKWGLV